MRPNQAPPGGGKPPPKGARRANTKIDRLLWSKRNELLGYLDAGDSYREALRKANIKGVSHQNLSDWYRDPARKAAAAHDLSPTFYMEQERILGAHQRARELAGSADFAVAVAREFLDRLRPSDPQAARLRVATFYAIPGLIGAANNSHAIVKDLAKESADSMETEALQNRVNKVLARSAASPSAQ